jgi:hypothetical protein
MSSQSSVSSSINNTERSDSADAGLKSLFIVPLSSLEEETLWVCTQRTDEIGLTPASATKTRGTSAQIPQVVPSYHCAGLEATTQSCSDTATECASATAPEATRAHASYPRSSGYAGYSNKVGTD